MSVYSAVACKMDKVSILFRKATDLGSRSFVCSAHL